MKCVVFDIDGTLLDNSHRRHFVEQSPKDWKSYNAAMALDVQNEPIVALCGMAYVCGYKIVICTGREEVYRKVTEGSLRFHYDHLFMRKTKDYRADEIIKSEILNQILAMGYEPLFIVDDRSSVVKMWRSRGYTCLQCAEGNF